jgi:outer membrane murein-binding lipoprotein Lpp
MKGKKIQMFIAAAVCGSVLLSGCSFGKTVSNVLDDGTEEVTTVSSSSAAASGSTEIVDDSVEAPVFDKDLKGCVTVIQGADLKLETAASVSDGGTVTYQWYRNNVNANGGGTEIGGATDAIVDVDTSETGAVFYYAVAVNTQGRKVNMSVSNTFEIKVTAKGQWQSDETGYKYMMDDGTFLTDTVLEEGGKMYTINADGYRTDDGTDIPVTLTSNDATMDPPQETDENTDSVSSSSAAAPAEAQ